MSKRSSWGFSLLSIALLFVAVAAFASAPSTAQVVQADSLKDYTPFPTPTLDPILGEGFVSKDTGGSMVSRDQRVTVTIPGGARAVDTKVVYRRIDSPTIAPPPGQTFLGKPFDLSLRPASDPTFELNTLAKPMTVNVRYTDAEAAGLNPSSFTLAYYAGTQWIGLASRVDTANHTVTADVDHFTLFAVIASPILVSQPNSSSTISGIVFYDKNGNGIKDGDDFPVATAGVRIRAGSWTSLTTTGADGRYTFANLGGDKYTISVEVGPEWTFTTLSVASDVIVSGQPGSNATDVNFGMWYRLPSPALQPE